MAHKGKARWLIEDFHGITRQLITTAYDVPKATIGLYSPEVYIDENPTTLSLFLDSSGISLTLTCGTIFRFSLQSGNNLSIMLTQKALQKSCIAPHVLHKNPIINPLTFLCSATYAVFKTGAIFHFVRSPSVLNSPSVSLSQEQRELLFWHYQLGHINIKHVQSLLQKPCSK